MKIENADEVEEEQYCYHIDMNWYKEQGRSFTTLAVCRLCPSSQKKKVPKSATTLLNTLRQCCSKWEGFIRPDMPLLEIIFRLFLSNNNEPLSLEQIYERLRDHLSSSREPKDFSVNKIKRILDSDVFYGLRPALVVGEEARSTSPQND